MARTPSHGLPLTLDLAVLPSLVGSPANPHLDAAYRADRNRVMGMNDIEARWFGILLIICAVITGNNPHLFDWLFGG